MVEIAKAQVYEAPDGFRWRSKGGNGEVIAHGESYVHRSDAVAAARASVPPGTPIEVIDEAGEVTMLVTVDEA